MTSTLIYPSFVVDVVAFSHEVRSYAAHLSTFRPFPALQTVFDLRDVF